jgi:hypothetical protein
VNYYKLVYIFGLNTHQTNKRPLFGSTYTVYLLHASAAFRAIIKECHKPIIPKDGITNYNVNFDFMDLSTLRNNGPEMGRNLQEADCRSTPQSNVSVVSVASEFTIRHVVIWRTAFYSIFINSV